MRKSQQESEKKSWIQRLTGIFRRNKTTVPKQKKEVTSADRDKRALYISLVVGLLQLLSFVNYLFANKDLPLTITDLRFSVGLFATACFVSVWLSRKGKGELGATIILIVVYITSFLTAITRSGTGAVIAIFIVGITLAFGSAVMSQKAATRVNVIALLAGAIFILMDIFEPFPRPPDPSAVNGTVIVGIGVIIFAVVVVRRFFTYNLRTKLIIAFATVTVLPLLIITLYNSTKLSDLLSQKTQETLTQFADQTANRVDNFIGSELASLQAQARTPTFVQYLSLNPTQRAGTDEESNARAALLAFTDQNARFINGYVLLDNKGLIVLSTAKTVEPEESKFFTKLVTKNQAVMNGPIFNQQNGKANLYFSAPVKNQSGNLSGVLVVKYDADVIQSVVKTLISPTNTNPILFHVVDKSTFVRIADSNDPLLLYKSYKDFTPAQLSSLQKQGLLLPGDAKQALAIDSEITTGLEKSNQTPFFTTLADKDLQIKYLNSAIALKNAPWLAFTQQSDAAVLTPLAQERRVTASIFITLLVIITLAAFGLSYLLASPILSLAAVAQKIAAGDLTLQSDIESNDEIGTLATAFNQMTRQTRALINSLEQRSKALATSSEVSRRISTILDQQELVTEVVKQVQMAFGYYHAHIYLLDETTQQLVMAGGTGEAGKAMLARNHKIPIGKGLVGRAAQNNITVLVTNVAEEPQWLPNPLLPNTKSEVAVPIAIAERVLGVLDVQHDVADVLKQEDVDVLQSIANQVAFAVRNARSYSEVQAKADRESLISSIGQKIQGTITVESAMQVAIREIGRALNGAKTQVTLNENSIADRTEENNITTQP